MNCGLVVAALVSCAMAQGPSIDASSDGKSLTVNADELMLKSLTGSESMGLKQRFSELVNDIADNNQGIVDNRQNISDIFKQLNQLSKKDKMIDDDIIKNGKAIENNKDSIKQLWFSLNDTIKSMHDALNTLSSDTNENITMVKDKLMQLTADTATHVGNLERNLTNLENQTSLEAGNLEGRIEYLEDHVEGNLDATNLFSQANFQDIDGNPAHVKGYIQKFSQGVSGMSLVTFDNPPDDNSNLTHGLKIDYGQLNPQQIVEYEMQSDKSKHPTLCGGIWDLTAWVRVSEDYDGVPMVMHCRFFGNGRNVAWAQTDEKIAKQIGAWPEKRGVWTQVRARLNVGFTAHTLLWYAMYPSRATKGTVELTGVSARRLGGDGACVL